MTTPVWKQREWREKAGRANFHGPDGRFYLVYCPECGRENYGPAVAGGVCSWCGYDGNEEPHGEDATP